MNSSLSVMNLYALQVNLIYILYENEINPKFLFSVDASRAFLFIMRYLNNLLKLELVQIAIFTILNVFSNTEK